MLLAWRNESTAERAPSASSLSGPERYGSIGERSPVSVNRRVSSGDNASVALIVEKVSLITSKAADCIGFDEEVGEELVAMPPLLFKAPVTFPVEGWTSNKSSRWWRKAQRRGGGRRDRR